MQNLQNLQTLPEEVLEHILSAHPFVVPPRVWGTGFDSLVCRRATAFTKGANHAMFCFSQSCRAASVALLPLLRRQKFNILLRDAVDGLRQHWHFELRRRAEEKCLLALIMSLTQGVNPHLGSLSTHSLAAFNAGIGWGNDLKRDSEFLKDIFTAAASNPSHDWSVAIKVTALWHADIEMRLDALMKSCGGEANTTPEIISAPASIVYRLFHLGEITEKQVIQFEESKDLQAACSGLDLDLIWSIAGNDEWTASEVAVIFALDAVTS